MFVTSIMFHHLLFFVWSQCALCCTVCQILFYGNFYTWHGASYQNIDLYPQLPPIHPRSFTHSLFMYQVFFLCMEFCSSVVLWACTEFLSCASGLGQRFHWWRNNLSYGQFDRLVLGVWFLWEYHDITKNPYPLTLVVNCCFSSNLT